MYSQKDALWYCKYLWNYNTDRQEISGQYLDNEIVSGDTGLQSRDKKTEIFGIQDDVDRHLEKRYFGHNSSTDCAISAKFCLRKQNGMPTKATWQKLQIIKIQDGKRPPFWKSLYRHISVKNPPI